MSAKWSTGGQVNEFKHGATPWGSNMRAARVHYVVEVIVDIMVVNNFLPNWRRIAAELYCTPVQHLGNNWPLRHGL